MHSTYKALAELQRAIKTVFLCRYLRLERFREIHQGLNVVENWNSANGSQAVWINPPATTTTEKTAQ